MAEAKAQKARRVLVNVVSSYDATVVRKTAVENSEEFVAFLAKPLTAGGIDSLDIMDIEMEVENELSISITATDGVTWKDFFDHLVYLLHQE